jgi:serine/threonine-protein kinase
VTGGASGHSNASTLALLSFSLHVQFAIGDRLGAYEILGHLGAGGMGEVYRALDAKLDREIALKILPTELSSNAEALRRFELEARAASALNHPNIVTIFDVGHTDSIAWIAMELVDGMDLRTMASKEPLTLKSALRIGVKIADGLAAAHDRGIVHRDLKPDNIMVTVDGFVKILDFGLAKQMRVLTSDDTTIPHTSPGAVFGTVGYMSPEQTTGKEMDYRSDQFSLGVMLYEMLTRVRPFDRETKPETMAAIIRAEIDPPSSLNDAIPHDLDRIVMRCLAKNPRERYASTRDLARDLREVRDGFTHSSMRTSRSAVRPVRGPASRWVLAAFVVIVLAGAGFMWVRRDRAMAGQRVTSVAVMPFRALGGAADTRTLADGLSQLVASRLGEARDLRVSGPFDRTNFPVTPDRAIVNGTVERGRDSVRVTYVLMEAATGRELASSTVTRPAADLFTVDDVIADDVLDALGRNSAPRVEPTTASLGPEDQRRFIEAVGLLQFVRDEKSVDRAIVTLESILGNARDSGSVNSLLARALLYKSTLARKPALIEHATMYARRGVAFSDEDPESHITLGRVQNAAGLHREAAASFRRALTLRPDDPHALTGLADATKGLGQAADAEKMYRQAIALRPDLSGLYSRYGSFCYGQGRYADAATQFRKAAELTPGFAHVHGDLGAALLQAGKLDEAAAAFTRSLALAPTAAGYSNLGTLQFSLGRYDDARKSYERATTLAPSDPVFWANLGDACFAANASCATDAWSRAIVAAREALQVNENHHVLRAIYATCLARTGKHDDARREIDLALAGDPTNATVLYQAAIIGAQRGAMDSALSWLERAVANGYPATEAERDPALSTLRKHPSFRNALKSAA